MKEKLIKKCVECCHLFPNTPMFHSRIKKMKFCSRRCFWKNLHKTRKQQFIIKKCEKCDSKKNLTTYRFSNKLFDVQVLCELCKNKQIKLMRKKYWENVKDRINEKKRDEYQPVIQTLKQKIRLSKIRSKNQKKLMSNEAYRHRVILKTLKKRSKTSFEKKVEHTIKKYNLPFRYTGDGSLFVGKINPDFVDTENKKIAVEVFFSWFKIKEYSSVEMYKSHKTKEMNKFGWKVVFIDEKELYEKIIVRKLQDARL